MGNTSDRVGKADDGTGTIRDRTDETIIFSSLLTCMLKLKKQSKQSESSSFPSYLIDVIWNPSFASCCL